jgi:uncharacterized protein (TIGR04168 family)
VPLVGYSCHEIHADGVDLSVVAARPHSMGGSRWHFERHMRERHGVDGFLASAARLRAVVNDCRHDDVLFLAHNGPTGLGERPDDIWGCDFKPELGDFGDPDLRDAIEHARSRGKRVRAVVAGHMHHRLAGGGQRRWHVERDGTQYINAARVPRIVGRGASARRHHVRLSIDAERVVVEERFES